MRYISLSGIYGKGKRAIIDDADFEQASKYKWNLSSRGYVVIGYKHGKKLYLHRYLLNTPKGLVTDHINGDKLDNRQFNIRICTTSQNGMNRKIQRNLSGFKGVYQMPNRKSNQYAVRLQVNNNQLYIGTYADKIEAAKAYDQAAQKYFGKFARLNFERSTINV